MISVKHASIIIALVFMAVSFVASQQPIALAVEDSIGPGPDSDSDGLSDSFEKGLGSDPTLQDSDSDGLSDGLEYTGGDSGIPTDLIDSDSDNDGLSDSYEASSGTNPIERDSDEDGLSDSFELITHNTDPLSSDTDKDGVSDNIEVWHGSDPLNPQSFFVLPEFPIGPIMMIIASMGALAGYLHHRGGHEET